MSNGKLRGIIGYINGIIHSSKGKEILIFAFFLFVAYIFWLSLTLNNEVQEDLEVKIELVDVPDSVTLITDIPQSVNVSVRDKGTSLIKYVWGGSPQMKIRFQDYCRENRFVMGEADIDSRLRAFFGNSSQILSSKPDSINAYFTTKPGRRVAVDVMSDIYPALQYVVTGSVRADVDSVSIYSISDLPLELNSVKTVPITRRELKDTTYIEARIVPVAGCRIIPDRVTVCVPVEPLIAKKRNIPVSAINVPQGNELITFPSSVEISYLIPISRYNRDDYEIEAVADYSKVNGIRIPLSLSEVPEYYKNPSLSTDSVEYLIQQK